MYCDGRFLKVKIFNLFIYLNSQLTLGFSVSSPLELLYNQNRDFGGIIGLDILSPS